MVHLQLHIVVLPLSQRASCSICLSVRLLPLRYVLIHYPLARLSPLAYGRDLIDDHPCLWRAPQRRLSSSAEHITFARLQAPPP